MKCSPQTHLYNHQRLDSIMRPAQFILFLISGSSILSSISILLFCILSSRVTDEGIATISLNLTFESVDKGLQLPPQASEIFNQATRVVGSLPTQVSEIFGQATEAIGRLQSVPAELKIGTEKVCLVKPVEKCLDVSSNTASLQLKGFSAIPNFPDVSKIRLRLFLIWTTSVVCLCGLGLIALSRLRSTMLFSNAVLNTLMRLLPGVIGCPPIFLVTYFTWAISGQLQDIKGIMVKDGPAMYLFVSVLFLIAILSNIIFWSPSMKLREQTSL